VALAQHLQFLEAALPMLAVAAGAVLMSPEHLERAALVVLVAAVLG
jgi:hypothetical protein